MNKSLKLKAALYYFLAFSGSSLVTYLLPGTSKEDAFVDIMGILLSVNFLCFGVFYAAIGAKNDVESST